MSEVNDVTLEYFTNPAYQFVLDKAGKGCNHKNGQTFNKGEHKFYRKRIAALMKEMNRGKFASEELMNGYQVFATLIIEHFKVLDKCEIVQEQYACGTKADGQDNMEPQNDDTSELVQELFNLFDVSDNMFDDKYDVSFNMVHASEPMMKKCIQAATLDNFVTVYNTGEETTKVIPVQLQIDLHDVKFKTKGLKSKKSALKTKTKKLKEPEDEGAQIK